MTTTTKYHANYQHTIKKIPLQELQKKTIQNYKQKSVVYIKKSASNCEKNIFQKKMKNPTRIKNETESKF